MTSLSIEDRMQILDLLARYCRALDTQRRKEFLDTFWPDGVLHSSLAGGDFAGHTRIAEWYDRIHTEPDFKPFHWGQHRPANVIFDDASLDRAVVWCQFELLTRSDGIPQVSSYGEYHDVITRRDGQWRFSRRVIQLAANAFGPTDT
jgi:hypothetical protein